MNQIVAVACGGAFGAVMRLLVSNGVYQWLGRGFPYGTLAVNVLGSFLLGLMTEALILQRIAISQEYRAAVLVGLFGSFTTFSTFSLDTLGLLEQGDISKAGLNMIVSLASCLLAVWIGLQLGRVLFQHAGGMVRWHGWSLPYGLILVNALGAFIIAMVSTVLIQKSPVSIEYSITFSILITGLFITLSSLYLVLHLLETEHTVQDHLNTMSAVCVSNVLVCAFTLWLGCLTARQI